ncbi:hypothetical protein JCM11251_006848 [Rhodosporidiobolus azoricus]
MSSPASSPVSARFPPYLRLNSATTLIGSDHGSDDGKDLSFDDDELLKPPLSPTRRDTPASDSSSSSVYRTVASHLPFAHSPHQRRRLLPYVVLLLSLTLSILAYRHVPTEYIPTSLRLSSSLPSPLRLPPTLVGPRPSLTTGKGTYRSSLYGPSCTAEEFLSAVKNSVLRPDGKSRDFSHDPVTEVTNPTDFGFSFDFPAEGKCAPPKVYSQDEACELLSAFGGVYMLGDSYARHIYTALLIVLRNRLDGGVVDYLSTDDCRGEHMYIENKSCRERVPVDTLQLPPDVPALCGGKVQMAVNQRWQYAGGGPNDTLEYALWRAQLPAEMQAKSSLFLESWGIHFNYDTPRAVPWLRQLSTFISSRAYPRPLNLMAGPHHPPANQPAVHIDTQGPVPVKKFKEEVELLYKEYYGTLEMWEGAGRYVDFFEATNGAKSFDGCHLPLQANLEKAHILLNLIDILHGDIVRHGGLIDPQI